VWKSYRYNLNKGNTVQFNSLPGIESLCGKADIPKKNNTIRSI